jgi:hypothetical protein
MSPVTTISIRPGANQGLIAHKPAANADNMKALSNTTFVDREGFKKILGDNKWETMQATVASAFNGDNPKLEALLGKGPAKIKFADGSYFLLVKHAGKAYALVPSNVGPKPFVGAQVFDSRFEFPGPGKNPRIVI